MSSQTGASTSARQPTPLGNGALAEASFISDEYSKAYSDDEDDVIEILESYPLLEYLKSAALPSFIFRGHSNAINLRYNQRSLSRWPEYRDLKREQGSRSLAEIVPSEQWERVALLTQDVLEAYRDTNIENHDMEEEEKTQTLCLPSPPLFQYESEDIQVLSNVQNDLELANIMKSYVLKTVSEAVRLMLRYPAEAPISDKLQFKIANSLCSAHHARWDIFALPTNAFNTMPLTVIFVPPWHFGEDDFTQFTSAQKFERGALDTLNTKQHPASDILWAIIHDVCKNRGHKFVVTNYYLWSFGEINQDYSKAQLTEPFEASTLDFNGTLNSGIYKGVNPVQILVLWMLISQGLVVDSERLD